jgi:hypothetical protein
MERFLESFIVSAGRVFQRSRGLHGRRTPPAPRVGAAVPGEPMRWRRSAYADVEHICAMTKKPKFCPEMTKSGRWFVAITTGYGDFATKEEAQRWISTKSKDWPHPVGHSK